MSKTTRTLPSRGAGNATAVQQNIPIPQALAIAAEKIDKGDLPKAEHIVRQVLDKQPENPHAHHLLGLVAHKVGRTELALEMIGKAIDLMPNVAQFHANRGEMCRLLKRLDEAIAHGVKATKLDLRSAAAYSNLGIAYYDKKDYDLAEAAQKKALDLNPQMVQALNNLGSIMRSRKERKAAMDLYRKVLTIEPDYLESMNNLGALLIEEHDIKGAIKVLLSAIKLNPNYAEAHNNIGNAFLVEENYDKANIAYKKALSLKPGYPEAMLGLARIDKEQDRIDDALLKTKQAIDLDPKKGEGYSLLGDIYLKQAQHKLCEQAYRRALSIDENLLAAHLGLGQLQMELGELEAAEATFNHSMTINPDEVAPYVFMAQARKVKPEDPVLLRLEAEAQKMADLPDTKAMSLQFALGKSYDDIREYDKSFPYIMEACRIKRSRINYSADRHDMNCKNIREFFTKDNISRLSGGAVPSDLPIFVLGMPRSGTTLVETIIASHSDVYGAGELHDILRIVNQPKLGVKSEGYPISMQGLTAEDVKEMGERYLDKLRQHDLKAARITDKMPANFLALGLIHLMLPQAKIVHIMRNPADICLSNFTKNFNSNSQPHSYDLVELARYYVNYAKIMEHWRQVLPEGSFYEVQYEELVAEPEVQTRKLIEYCGLPWEDACLTPHKTERSVKTASVTQVRQPVYTSSIERWRRYEKYLQPMLDALGEYSPQ